MIPFDLLLVILQVMIYLSTGHSSAYFIITYTHYVKFKPTYNPHIDYGNIEALVTENYMIPKWYYV